jgi:hypothetical protein
MDRIDGWMDGCECKAYFYIFMLSFEILEDGWEA